MIRRSFRIGLTLGLLGGLAFALAKMLGGRPEREAAAPVPTQPWPRLATDPTEPAPPTAALQPDPEAPVAPRFPPAEPAPEATAPAAEAPTAKAATAAPAPTAPAPAKAPARKAPAGNAPAKPAAARPSPAEPANARKAPPKKAPPKKASAAKAAKKKPLVAPWVEPTGDVCPTSHPIKGKLASKIFHLPGMLNYDRTKPDRCYRDVPAAETDGLRPAKR